MTAVGAVLLAMSVLAIGAATLAVAACIRRRWWLAVGVARTITLAGPCVLAVAVAVVVALAGASDAPTKATALAVGIAELMNCGVLVLVAVLACAIVWGVGARRLRRDMQARHG